MTDLTRTGVLSAFYERCRGIDWFYEYSDDPYTYRAGKAKVGQLFADARQAGADVLELVEAYEHAMMTRGELPPHPAAEGGQGK